MAETEALKLRNDRPGVTGSGDWPRPRAGGQRRVVELGRFLRAPDGVNAPVEIRSPVPAQCPRPSAMQCPNQ
ncbi:hypothetical protein PF004_g6401 [Phytophthora fragariae]|uniref:Uncharacterized protein n=1 Tax=Phytophthora fragariae TaxID=53985 RepID=A0A6G0PD27_9STRA|nr:hypothetical protein PF004_g6401 [Phytophthora fragariae]